MMLGERALKVQKASIGITQVAGEMGVNAMSMLAGTTSTTDSQVSRVLQLLNMVTPEELMDNDDYEGTSTPGLFFSFFFFFFRWTNHPWAAWLTNLCRNPRGRPGRV